MKESDFRDSAIHNFTAKEIKDTGARLEEVQLLTIFRLNMFRVSVGKKIKLQKNGLTTGEHSSPEHKDGKAVDFYFDDGSLAGKSITEIVFMLVSCGFHGIGVYHNGKAYSFHADIGQRLRSWTAIKDKTNNWQYSQLFIDPKIMHIN